MERFLGFLLFMAISFWVFVHVPIWRLLLFAFTLWTVSDDIENLLGIGKYRDPPSPTPSVPAKPPSWTQELEEQYREERIRIAQRKELTKRAMQARRELEEDKEHELRLLIENLKADRNKASDPEVRSILAQFNAYQIHGTANDFDRLLRVAREKLNQYD